jgi:LysM repeat protein
LKRALISVAVTAAAVCMSAVPALASPARTYHVQPGNSFWSIGQKFGVNMQKIASFNGMSLEQTLYAGSYLRIPTRDWAPRPAPATEASTVTADTRAAGSSAPSTGYAPSGVWACIAQHESNGNPATDTGNGFYGMYQFTLSTWQAAGGSGNPADASAAEQTAVAQRVQQMQGWGAWPVTSQMCGV